MVNKLVNIGLVEYSPIFAEPGVNSCQCFSIIIQVPDYQRQTTKQSKNVNFTVYVVYVYMFARQ